MCRQFPSIGKNEGATEVTEHQQCEYKQIWKNDWLKTICAFANAQGGVLRVGFDDDGEVIGLDHHQKLMEDIPNKVRDVLGIMVEDLSSDALTRFRTRAAESKRMTSSDLAVTDPVLIEKLNLIECDHSDMWVEFPFVIPKAATEKTQGETAGKIPSEKRGEKRGEKLSANRQSILEAMRHDPTVTHKQLVELVGIGTTSIEKNIQYLKQQGWISRVGPAKGGHWEVQP
jgi:predicted HTH transcriptional regulator